MRRLQRRWRLYGLFCCLLLTGGTLTAAGFWLYHAANIGTDWTRSDLPEPRSPHRPRDDSTDGSSGAKSKAKTKKSENQRSPGLDTEHPGENKPARTGVNFKRDRPERPATDKKSKKNQASTPSVDHPPRTVDLVDLDWHWYVDPLTWGQDRPLADTKDLLTALGQADLEKVPRGSRRGFFRLDGWYELTRPLGQGWNLRLAIDRPKNLTIDLWHNDSGVRLQLGNKYWHGYRLQREDGQSRQPRRVHRAARGSGASGRFGHGSFDLSYQQGHVVLSRGGLIITALPLSHSPTQTLIHGKGDLYLARMRPAARLDLPAYPPRVPTSRGESAEMQWQTPTPHTRRLALPESAQFDVCFQIDDAPAGTDFFIESNGGKQRTLASIRRIDGQRLLLGADADKPRFKAKQNHWGAGESFWLRFLDQYGRVLVMASLDERVWYVVDGASMDGPDASRTGESRPRFLGVHLAQDGEPNARTPRLEQAQLRIHHALVDLARGDLVSRIADSDDAKLKKKLSQANSLDQSHKAASPLKPSDVDDRTWALAVNAAVVEMGISKPELTRQAVDQAIVLAIDEGVSTTRILGAFDELGMRYELGLGPLDPGRLRRRFDRLGRRESALGHEKNLARILQTWLDLDLTAARQLSDGQAVVPPDLNRDLFYRRMHADDWEAVRGQALRTRFLARDSAGRFDGANEGLARLSRWMLARAAEQLGSDSSLGSWTTPRSWQHPLSIRRDRPTQTTLAEALAAVETDQVQQAARLLTAKPIPDQLVADKHDSHWFGSSHDLIRSIIDHHPKLSKTLAEQFGQTGEIRVRRALHSADVKALRSVAAQFHRTSAGVRAERALADRALSMGRFISAAYRYDTLAKNDNPPNILTNESTGRPTRARRRLAWAMIGQRRGDPITEPVRLGQQRFTAERFETIIQNALQTHGDSSTDTPYAIEDKRNGLDPGPFKVSRLTALSLDGDRNKTWSGNPIGITADSKRIVITTSTTTAAYHPDTGRQLWLSKQAVQPGGNRDLGRQISSHPLISDPWVYRRWEHDGQGYLRAMGEDDARLWQIKIDDGVISDPVRIGHDLYVLSKEQTPGNHWRVNLHRLDPKTGQSLAGEPLFGLTSRKNQRLSACLKFKRNRLIIHLPGVVAATDSRGKLRWVRRLAYVPREVDSSLWVDHAKPIQLADDRLLVTTPGSPYVQCLDPADGQQRWSVTMAEAQGIIGTSDDLAYVRTQTGITALSLNGGSRRWSRFDPPGTSRYLPNSGDGPLRINLDPSGNQWTLAWLNPADGSTHDCYRFVTDRSYHLDAVIAGAGAHGLYALATSNKDRRLHLLTID